MSAGQRDAAGGGFRVHFSYWSSRVRIGRGFRIHFQLLLVGWAGVVESPADHCFACSCSLLARSANLAASKARPWDLGVSPEKVGSSRVNTSDRGLVAEAECLR